MRIIHGNSGAAAGVLVIHSWWGLTPSFDVFARKLAATGPMVGLTDLFDGRTATTEPEARKLRGMRRREPMYQTLGRDLETLRAEGAARIGVVGFSMGGHWAVWLSQHPEYEIAAAVLYYAARGGDFRHSRAAYLAHFAADDPWVSPTARRGMERGIDWAGRAYRAHDYPGTGHWFAETDRDTFDPQASEQALARTIDFLARSLGVEPGR